jgi:hypothetical protein
MRIGSFTAEFLGGVFADDVPVAQALARRAARVGQG